MKLYNLTAAGIHEDVKNKKQIIEGIAAVSTVSKIHAKVVGSGALKALRYYSDIDLFSRVDKLSLSQWAKAIQTMVKKMPAHIIYSDFKAGARGSKWTRHEILAGRKANLTLERALSQKAVTKIDVIHKLKSGRFVEITNFFYHHRYSASLSGYLKSMQEDVKKYRKLGRHLKAMKRKMMMAVYRREDINEFVGVINHPEIGERSQLLADIEVANRLSVLNKALALKQQLLYIARKLKRKKLKLNDLPAIQKEISAEINKNLKRIRP